MSEQKEKKMRQKELKRRNVMAAVDRIEEFVKKYNLERDAGEVKLRLDRLDHYMEVFETIETEYEGFDDSDEFVNANLATRAKFEEQYFRTKAGLISKLPTPLPAIVNEQSSTSQTGPLSSLAGIKLPTIKLPEFNGKFDDWLSFHDTFLALIHTSMELTSVQKFHYLRAALGDEPAKLIESLSITANNYTVAWELLRSRYSNKYILRKKHLQALLECPRVKRESVLALHNILDCFERHTKVLQQLGEPVEHWSSMLVELISSRLDDVTLKAWEDFASLEENQSYTKMVEFLQRRTRILESLSVNNQQFTQSSSEKTLQPPKRPGHSRIVSHATTEKTYPKCIACSQNHPLLKCSIFDRMSLKERLDLVNTKKVCSNCFRNDHFARSCQSKYTCRVCHKRHHTMLHPGFESSTINNHQPENSSYSQNPALNVVSTNCSVQADTAKFLDLRVNATRNANVFLSTVVVVVLDAFGQEHIARALLDCASQANLMSDRLRQTLRLNGRKVNIEICGVDKVATRVNYSVSTSIRSRVHDMSMLIDFLVVNKVTRNLPTATVSIEAWKIPKNLVLADPEFHRSREIDMIIGAEYYYKFIRNGRVYLGDQLPTLVESDFGWLVSGKADFDTPDSSIICSATTLESLDEKLERFWMVEDVCSQRYSVEDRRCEEFYLNTTSRNYEGRYIVRLPKQDRFDQMLGESKLSALRRFESLERKLQKNPELRLQYNSFMEEYISLGHMQAVQDTISDSRAVFYLPHHPVFKQGSSTTKLRVVFDGSAVTSTGKSLNEALLVGPVIQDELLDIVLRFRKYPVALVADIEKMYRQVLISSDERCLQRILWRFDSTQPLITYELNTVTYGLAPSSFLATRTLHQLTEDEGSEYPLGSNAIRKHFYVDDFIGGENSVDRAIQLRHELGELLMKGGFRLRKWCSNFPDVLAGLPSELLGSQSTLKFDPDETIKTLGICWEPAADRFRYDINLEVGIKSASKRNILSRIAQLYDPLGLIAPVVIVAKIMMQQMWVLSLGWDDHVPQEIEQRWVQFCEQLSSIAALRIDRFSFIHGFVKVELHCFADASEAAYGACIYARSETTGGEVKINLLASKSRVAPLKRISLPRLELCGALLAARLYERIVTAMNMVFVSTVFWTDSTVVLQWLKSPPHNWKTFVANRTSEIQSITHGCMWLHISGSENPADMVSRGVSANELVTSDRWFHGPKWLAEKNECWPVQNLPKLNNLFQDLERKQVVLAIHTTAPGINEMFVRYSCYHKLITITAYCLRFLHNTRSKTGRILCRVPLVRELISARTILVKVVQNEVFKDDLRQLQLSAIVSKKSRLKLLNPFIDSEGVIRVGGRLRLSSELYSIKHPILLPGFHPFSKLLIHSYHRTLLHGGTNLTLAVIRDDFWLIHGRRAVQSAIRKCHNCARANPQPIQQPTGQLPRSRVTPSQPFSNTGIDYCGPVYIRTAQRRTSSTKAYIAIFVCFSTKAVHIELVGDLSTPAFISALRRFVARRGRPEHIYSDNAKTFIGAANELHRLYQMLQPGPDSELIAASVARNGIQWHLIPPKAPNFGGLWEAAVKVAKKHLVRQIGNASLTYEDMVTVLTQIEGCMNSRPLTALTDDPHDPSVLTPSHFLVGKSLQSLPDPDIREIPTNRLDRYQRIQEKVQHFWHRWRSEYLRQLHQLACVNPMQSVIKIGSIVVMKNELLPPMQWPLARVLEIHPGEDGVTRVATLRTANGIFKRAVSKICPLPSCEVEEGNNLEQPNQQKTQ